MTNINIIPSPIEKPAYLHIAVVACVASTAVLWTVVDSDKEARSPISMPEHSMTTVISTPLAGRTSYTYGNMSIYAEGVVSLKPDCIENLKVLEQIKQLPANWNYNGAMPFSTNIINMMCKIITHLPYQPSVFPTAQESIQFEFENSRGDYLEFELFESKRLKEFFVPLDGESFTKDIQLESLNDEVAKFYDEQV